MDLFEAFKGAEKLAKKEAEAPAEAEAEVFSAKPSEAAMDAQVLSAVKAFDAALSRRQSYDIERDRLMAEVEKKLSQAKDNWEEARVVSDAATAALKVTMEELGISKIPMKDRKAIALKITTGRKKAITKKWLTQEFGEQRAGDIWGKVPKTPDKTSVVIPPRYEDEPSD